MIAPPEKPDTAEVQRLIPYGYMLNRCRHFVLRVKKPAEARCFIGKLVEKRMITTASVHTNDVMGENAERRCPVNIGFTFRGLKKLELEVPYLRVFEEKAKAFVEGASARAARRLADSGPSASPVGTTGSSLILPMCSFPCTRTLRPSSLISPRICDRSPVLPA
jgi:hypothetical protein